MSRLFVFAALLIMTTGAVAQEPMSVEEARATALDFADKLEEGYMDPDIGRAYAEMLRGKTSQGAYDAFTDPNAYAEQITEDVQIVNADAHLSLRLAGQYTPRPTGDPNEQASLPPFLGETKWLDNDIAYTEWLLFLSTEESVAKAREIMQDYAGAKALIFDMRRHRGGDLKEMDVFFSYLFAEPTHLVTMKIRQGKGQFMADMLNGMKSMRKQPTANGIDAWQHWTLKADDDLGWSDTPVYVLTSKGTASAAEHFTLSMKTTGRATIIGETTAGAGHFGGVGPVGERFAAFIPVGETVDPKTDKGWETVGIAPDVEAPAEDALDKAVALATVKQHD